MKKLFLATIMIMGFGCEEQPIPKVKPVRDDFVRKFSYQNHDYIKFSSGGNGQWGVHDPDCKNSIHKQ